MDLSLKVMEIVEEFDSWSLYSSNWKRYKSKNNWLRTYDSIEMIDGKVEKYNSNDNYQYMAV